MYKVLLLLLFIAFIDSACKKDEDNPDYVGTWYQSYTENGLTFRQLLTLKKSSFEMLIQLQNPINQSNFINYMAQKGKFNVQQDILTITLTSIGISETNPATFMPTGNLIFYDTGTAEFINLLKQAGFDDPTFKAKYSVSDNKLTLIIDINNNGSFNDDEDASEVFTRQ